MPQDRRSGRGQRYGQEPQDRGRDYPQSGPQHPDLISMGQHARGFVTAALVGTARHVSGQSSGQPIPGAPIIPGGRRQTGRFSDRRRQPGRGQARFGKQGQHDPQSRQRPRSDQIHRGFAWDVPQNKQAPLIFDQGNLSQVFDVSGQMVVDSPSATIALIHFWCQHASSSQAFFEVRLETLLSMCYPHPAAIQHSRSMEQRQFSDGQLTVGLSQVALSYLQYVHGIKSFTRQQLTQLAERAIEIADALERHGDDPSHRRQCHARCIAADLLNTVGDYKQADTEMGKALILIAIAYHNTVLVDIATGALGDTILKATLTDNETSRLSAAKQRQLQPVGAADPASDH